MSFHTGNKSKGTESLFYASGDQVEWSGVEMHVLASFAIPVSLEKRQRIACQYDGARRLAFWIMSADFGAAYDSADMARHVGEMAW